MRSRQTDPLDRWASRAACGSFRWSCHMHLRDSPYCRRCNLSPLPSGCLSPGSAVVLGLVSCLAGLLCLVLWVNSLSALIGFVTAASYLGIYAPLKKVSSLATIVGAVPGALPPVLGWAAASGSL